MELKRQLTVGWGSLYKEDTSRQNIDGLVIGCLIHGAADVIR